MLKGDISNKFAPVIVLDMNLLFEKEKEGINKLLGMFGFHRYKIKDKNVAKYLEKWFFKDYTIYIVERNTGREVIGEKYLEEYRLDYSSYFHYTEEQIKDLLENEEVLIAVFDEDFGIGRLSKKGVPFSSWQNVFERLGML